MVRGKKGILRIAEAFFSILIILIFMITILPKQFDKKGESESIGALLDEIEAVIKNDETLRQKVLGGTTQEVEDIKNSISAKILPNLEFELRICSPSDVCALGAFHKEVFSSEFIVSATLQQYAPKKVKLFVWKKEV